MHLHNNKTDHSRKPKFKGAVIDTVTARSCIGKKQAIAYAMLSVEKHSISKSNLAFKFGDKVHKSLGIFDMKLPIRNGHSIEFECDIVHAEFPLLLGLDVMREYGLIIDVRDSSLQCAHWKVPIYFNNGHLWIPWFKEILYSRKQLLKLHKHFRHPSAKKLFALLKRVTVDDLPRDILDVLKQIQSECDP